MAQPDLAQAGKLHQQLLAKGVEVQASLERGDIRRPGLVVGRAQALSRRGGRTLGLREPGPLDAIVREERLERVACLALASSGGSELAGDDVALFARRPLPVRERGEVALDRGDPGLRERNRCLRTRSSSVHVPAGSIVLRDIGGEPVTAGPDLADA